MRGPLAEPQRGLGERSLRTALVAARPRTIEIDVVNSSSQDRERLRGLFEGLGTVVLFESIDNFLTGRAP